MACYEKYKADSVSMMLNHYDRHEEELRQRGNDAIDMSRTHQNYSLLEAESVSKETAYQHYKKRLSEVYCCPRADVNTLVDCVVTLPKDVSADRSKEFFQTVFDFLCNQHSRQNVIAATVHMDETTPHIHFAFIPVVPDDKHGFKVCAKEVLSPRYLNQFHKQLSHYVEKQMGMSVGILNGATLGGNRTVAEMKLAKKKEELQSVEVELAARKYELNLTNRIGELVDAFTPVKQKLEEMERVFKSKHFWGPSEKDKYQAAIDYSQKIAEALEAIRKLNDEILQGIRIQLQEILDGYEREHQQVKQETDRQREAVTEKDRHLEEEISARTEREIAVRATKLLQREKELRRTESALSLREQMVKRREDRHDLLRSNPVIERHQNVRQTRKDIIRDEY